MSDFVGEKVFGPITKEEDFNLRKFEALSKFTNVFESQQVEFNYSSTFRVDDKDIECPVLEIIPEINLLALHRWCQIVFEGSEISLNGKNMIVNDVGNGYIVFYVRNKDRNNFRMFVSPREEINDKKIDSLSASGLLNTYTTSPFGVSTTQLAATEKLKRNIDIFMLGGYFAEYDKLNIEKTTASQQGQWNLVNQLETKINDVMKYAYNGRNADSAFRETLRRAAME